ncbi:MAG: 16S rRNA (guanine(966)-N(2))-methyltransferase RsmD [Acholeplasmataceae bacterium]
MRIISGYYRGMRIKRVKHPKTRETADMVREAVFNMLGPIDGAVLDLFAGSGAYGLEALSRGASSVHLVDVDRIAVRTIIENVSLLGASNRVRIRKSDYRDYLKGLKEDQAFDIAFIDPPYDLGVYQDALKRLVPYLARDALVVVESHKKQVFAPEYPPLNKHKERTYGNKRITIYRKG